MAINLLQENNGKFFSNNGNNFSNNGSFGGKLEWFGAKLFSNRLNNQLQQMQLCFKTILAPLHLLMKK